MCPDTERREHGLLETDKDWSNRKTLIRKRSFQACWACGWGRQSGSACPADLLTQRFNQFSHRVLVSTFFVPVTVLGAWATKEMLRACAGPGQRNKYNYNAKCSGMEERRPGKVCVGIRALLRENLIQCISTSVYGALIF